MGDNSNNKELEEKSRKKLSIKKEPATEHIKNITDNKVKSNKKKIKVETGDLTNKIKSKNKNLITKSENNNNNEIKNNKSNKIKSNKRKRETPKKDIKDTDILINENIVENTPDKELAENKKCIKNVPINDSNRPYLKFRKSMLKRLKKKHPDFNNKQLVDIILQKWQKKTKEKKVNIENIKPKKPTTA